MEGVIHRAGCDADLPLIFDSWLRHVNIQLRLPLGQPKYKLTVPVVDLPQHVFADVNQGYRRKVEAILERAKVTCAVAVENPTVIYAFLVWEPPNVAHFACTKGRFRHYGLFSALMREAFGEYADRGPILHTEVCRFSRQWKRMQQRTIMIPNPRWTTWMMVASQGTRPAVAVVKESA